jgi:hypothetical protein
MKHLLEIARIVTKKKVKKIEIFDEQSLRQKNSKFNEFYEAVLSEKFQTDEEAAQFLYSCVSTDDKYRQFKSRFKKRMLNTLFFLDINQPAYSNYNRAYYSCNRDWSLVKILLSNQANETASLLAKQILSTALKFKFADIIVNCSRILREYYAVVDKADREYEIYDNYCKQYQNVQDAEIRSEELYQRVVMNYNKPVSKNNELELKIDIYCEALEGLSEIYPSPIVHYNKYMVLACRYEMLNDYENMLAICNKAEIYIDQNPDFYRDDKLGEIALKKASAFLHMRSYGFESVGGKSRHDELMETLEKTDIWIELLEYHFLIAVHSAHYIDASLLFHVATQDKRFPKVSELEREKWNTFEIYLYYFNLLNSCVLTEPVDVKAKKRKKFRLKKFLTEPILLPKSLRPLIITQIIAQVLFLIEKKNLDDAIEKVERLKSYAYRQLSKEEDNRTIQFIKLLHQLAKVNFEFQEIGVYQKYLDKLNEQPFKYRGLLNELEIIPYENLWELILDRLKK